jgi:hypothetical protein
MVSVRKPSRSVVQRVGMGTPGGEGVCKNSTRNVTTRVVSPVPPLSRLSFIPFDHGGDRANPATNYSAAKLSHSGEIKGQHTYPHRISGIGMPPSYLPIPGASLGVVADDGMRYRRMQNEEGSGMRHARRCQLAESLSGGCLNTVSYSCFGRPLTKRPGT